ncbi:hypothetical protein NHF48_005145 [Sphingomonas sp. H160509]|uniref:hypothetical protein n=1 Tax=Sphingomonas sp. H160509 TaxID=2955313 RepID=UPI002097DD3B|nr:hypothetical protein [Sphingomonas sp. H160509]MDD1450514.1 hypothetical protein [Sphingomonas sp. H160509]
MGEPLGDAGLEADHVDLLGRTRDQERGEEFGAVVVGEELDDGLRDAGPFADHRFDLGEFDAEAADLDLRVDPADEIDVARRVELH